MSKYDFALRLKRMISEECKMVNSESKIAQKCVTYYEQVSSLKATLDKHEEELIKYRNEVEKLTNDDDELEKYKIREEERLHSLMQKIEQMEDEYNQKLQEQVQQWQTAKLKMDCTRSLKLATRTFINVHALPERIQGVILNETNSSREWKPFVIDPSKHTQKEAEDALWHDDQIDCALQKTWKKLIFGECLQDMVNCSEIGIENAIVENLVKSTDELVYAPTKCKCRLA